VALAALLACCAALAASPAQTAFTNLPAGFDSGTLVVLPATTDPVPDGVIEGAWDEARGIEAPVFGASGNWPGGAGVRVRALHNATTLFMLIEWADGTIDDAQEAWQLIDNSTPEGSWVRTSWGDDAMLVFFDNGTGAEQNFSEQGCAALCHTGAVHEMRTDMVGFVDVWKWSASRSNIFRYADDMYADNESKVTGSPAGGLHGDAAEPNAPNNVTTAFGDRPAYFNSTAAPATSPKFVLDSQKTSIDWSTFDSSTLPNGTTVAGSVLGVPTGGRADVRAAASHNGTAWRLELARPFATGDNESRDKMITQLGVPYYFGLAVLNNKTGENHSAGVSTMKLVLADNVLPDLVARIVTLGASPSLIGDPVDVTVAVRNNGFGNSTVQAFVSIVDDITALEVANATAPPITWNEEYLVNLSFSSVGFLPGRHNFTAVLDTTDAVAESSETNNTYSFNVTFVSTLASADIVLDTVTGPVGLVYAGDIFYINGTVRNGGTGDSVVNVTVRGFHPLFGSQNADVGPLLSNQSANFSLSWDSTGKPRGSHNFNVTADPDNLIVELDEGNNELPVQVRVEDRPDLVADALSADPASGFVNDTILLNFTLHNAGAPTAGPLAVWVYLDDGLSMTALNRTDIWNLTIALNRGDRVAVSFNWTIPVLVPGTHLIRAWVDPADAFAEIAETNNNASVQLTVRPPPLPDLAATAASLNATQYRIGESGTATVDVSNAGVNYTGDITVQLVDATANRVLAVAVLTPIPQNGSTRLTLSFTLANGTLGLHSVLVLVDPTDMLDEATELNNVFSLEFTLLPAAAPNLVVVQVTFGPASPTRGDTVHLEAEVKNNGTAAAPATRMQFLHGVSALTDLAVPALDPGASAVVAFDWNTSQLTSLSALISAVADSQGQVAELSEADNGFSITINFQRPGTPDIELVNLAVSPTNVRPGGRVDVTVVVFNNGSVAGDGALTVRVDGVSIGTFSFSLASRENRTFSAAWNATTVGTHGVRAELNLSGAVVEQLHASVDVQGDVTAPPLNLAPLLAVVVVGGLLAIFLWARKAKKPPAKGETPAPDAKASEPAAPKEPEPEKKAP
jgi:subtilase family serine protease